MVTTKEIIMQCADKASGEEVYDSKLFPPSIYYRFFRLLAAELKPKLSVELGVCGGGGSLHLAMGNPEGQVIGIDKIYDHPEQIEHIYARCKNFEFIVGTSWEIAGKIANRYGKVDILFIDTDHTYETTLKEFDAWYPHLNDGAIVCLDDLFREGMEEAFNQLPGEKLRLDHIKGGQRNPGEVGQEGGFGAIFNIFKK